MAPRFLKIYFYSFLSLFFVFLIISLTCGLGSLYDVYRFLTYHDKEIPIYLISGLPAFFCFLSLGIAKLFVKKQDAVSMRISWKSSIVLLLFFLGFVFVTWLTRENEYYIDYLRYCYSDLILLGVFSFIAFSLISVICYTIRLIKQQMIEKAKMPFSWSMLFFILTLGLSLIYLLPAIICFERSVDTYSIGFPILLVTTFTLVSMGAAVLGATVDTLMEKNKSLSFMIGVIVVGILLGMNGLSLFLVYDSAFTVTVGIDSHLHASAKAPVDTYDSVPEKEEYEIYYKEFEEEYEEDGEDWEEALVDEDYNPLWYESESPRDSIEGVFQHINKEISYIDGAFHFVLFYAVDEYESSYKNMNHILYQRALNYISDHRETIQLSRIIKRYRWFLLEVLPLEVYCEKGFDKVAEGLRYAYEDLSAGAPNKFEQIYEIMSQDADTYENWIDGPFEEFSEFTSIAACFEANAGDIYESWQSAVWAYSFWGRRWSEGNLEEACKVLSVLNDIY